MTITVFTGIMISENVAPLLGIEVAKGGIWKLLHTQAADLSVFLIGLHLALHWSWVVHAVNRYAVTPVWTSIARVWAAPRTAQSSEVVSS